MLRKSLEPVSSIYNMLKQVDADTDKLTSTNCSSRKSVKHLCASLRAAGYLKDFNSYAEQVAAIRHDHISWPLCQMCGTKVSMFNGFFVKFCSRKCSNSSSETIKKKENTCLTLYGVRHQWCLGEMRDQAISSYMALNGYNKSTAGNERRMKTYIERFGSHPMQTGEIFNKAIRNRLNKKDFVLPSGKTLVLMGHEPKALEFMINAKSISEEELVAEKLPVIKYGQRAYHPDFWIPGKNLIIEVKSEYTAFYKQYLSTNILKEEATIKSGFNYEIWIWHPKTKSVEVLKTFKNRGL